MGKIIDNLINQSAKPEGLTGNIMTKIWQVSFRKLSKFTLPAADIRDGDRILEVGIGGGVNLEAILDVKSNVELYGIDISEESIKAAGRLLKPYKNKVILSGEDVMQMDFADDFFDTVLAMQTHIYWKDVKKGLTECFRVLKKGGKLIISSEKDKIEYHFKAFKETVSFIKLLEQVGFKDIEVSEKSNFILFKSYK